MRRIVHYYPGAMGHSGVTFALWEWARAQARAGAEVRVLHGGEAWGAEVDFVDHQDCPGLSSQAVPHSGHRRWTRRPIDLHRYLGRNDVLVLHEGWVASNLAAGAAARRAGVPYIVMPHGAYERAWMSYLKPPRWLRDRLERQLLEGAAAVHIFFESEMFDVAALAPGASFLSVPTGFDLPREQWSGGGGYLAWIGRVDPTHKGLDLLVGAVGNMTPRERPSIRIHGYDYQHGVERLRRLVHLVGLERWIRVEGAVAGDEKTRFLQEADGYIHPSRWECHSIALLENLALGVPCLVSNSIHIAPTLERSRAAVLAQPTVSELAGALRRLIADPAEVARRGRDLVARAFNWTTLMPRYQAALGRLGL
jgi:glycosyltransferase involved in cell wall biosynthesis